MKLTTAIMLILLGIFCANDSQAQAIRFEKGLTWTEIVAKAKAEKKFIFLDCFATWCGPCKFMNQFVFTQRTVGEYFNEHFINVTLQMDQTGVDPADVRQSYALAKRITRDYGVTSYPTYLFFDSLGVVVHRVVGSTGADGNVFIKQASNAFTPDSQYYALINLYKEHLNDSGAIRTALIKAVNQDDQKNGSILAGLYLHFLHWPYSQDDLSLLRATLHSTKDTLFGVFLRMRDRIDSLESQDWVENLLHSIVFYDEIVPLFDAGMSSPLRWSSISNGLGQEYPSLGARLISFCKQGFGSCINREIGRYISEGGKDSPRWTIILNRLKERFPDYDCSQLLAERQVSYYAGRQQWAQCDTAIIALLEKFKDSISPREINYVAWDCVFLHMDDKMVLSQVVAIYQRLVKDYPRAHYRYLDTYANILYKSGNSKDAIIWESRAIDQIEGRNLGFDDASLKEFKITLQKMQTGEKTWEQRNAKGAYL